MMLEMESGHELPTQDLEDPLSMASVSNVVDLRGLVKPPMFDGLENHWQEYRFNETLVRLIGCGEILTKTNQTDTVEFERMRLHPNCLSTARLMYGLLVQSATGKALNIVRNTRDAKGLLALETFD